MPAEGSISTSSNVAGLDATPVTFGIQPVPQQRRRLTALDFAVLWGDLGVGLLVLAAGALLVQLGLGVGDALLATLIGSVLGCALLALGGYIAADAGVPTMVLTRAAVGVRGSALPTALNVLQLLGWTSFEILVMGKFAERLGQQIGLPAIYPVWAGLIAAFCTAMALGGPLVVVRQWLRKFGVWAMLVTTVAVFALLAVRYDLPAILSRQGSGDLGFWVAVDIVVSLPVSWLPLVADYNRFAQTRLGSFWGTFGGYFLANVTFFALGILAVVALQTDADALNLSGALADLLLSGTGLAALGLGLVAVAVILADETDNGFANIYSTAVSAQNVLTRAPQRLLIVAAGAIGLGIAMVVQTTQYEAFLLLIGSSFVPLVGVVAADYFVVRRGRYEPDALFARGGRYWYTGGLNLLAIATWLVGFAVYQWISPSGPVAQLGLPAFPAQIGGTIPSFAAAFGLYAILGRLTVRR
jgi:NCS1 family nucleobase:cation symporter-1